MTYKKKWKNLSDEAKLQLIQGLQSARRLAKLTWAKSKRKAVSKKKAEPIPSDLPESLRRLLEEVPKAWQRKAMLERFRKEKLTKS